MSVSKEWTSLPQNQKDLILSHQSSFPVKVGEIAKNLGISVKAATLDADVAGQIKEENGIVVIKVNRHDVKTRQRYTVAHEIAHFLLHRHLLVQGITDNELYRSKVSDRIEAEANRLAADIVMPMNLINDVKTMHPNKKGSALHEILANEADVSMRAIEIRMGL